MPSVITTDTAPFENAEYAEEERIWKESKGLLNSFNVRKSCVTVAACKRREPFDTVKSAAQPYLSLNAKVIVALSTYIILLRAVSPYLYASKEKCKSGAAASTTAHISVVLPARRKYTSMRFPSLSQTLFN